MKKRKPVYKSKLEEQVAEELGQLKIKAIYEPCKLPYTLELNYIPDWITYPNEIIVEAKGKLDSKTRQKMLAVQKRHPHLDIRFIFQRASNKLYKGSKTTYGEWATKHGFKWCELPIPKGWLSK